MSKALTVLGILALVFAVLAYPAALVIGATATEAYMIAGKDPGMIAVEQELFEPPKNASKDSKEYRDAVLRIYGVPTDDTTKIVFWPKEKFLQPKQLPTITILPVYKEKGDDPIQLKTVYFLAVRALIGAALTGAILLVVGAVLGKKKAPAPPAAA